MSLLSHQEREKEKVSRNTTPSSRNLLSRKFQRH
jgi:hypothetical protein